MLSARLYGDREIASQTPSRNTALASESEARQVFLPQIKRTSSICLAIAAVGPGEAAAYASAQTAGEYVDLPFLEEENT